MFVPIASAAVPACAAAVLLLVSILTYVSSTFVDRAVFIWPTFTASLSSVPAATLTIWRVNLFPSILGTPAPTDTVLSRSATEPKPNATALLAPALDVVPIATEPVPVDTAARPVPVALPSATL